MPQYSGMWTLSQAQAAIQAGNWTNLPPTTVEFFIVGGGGAGGGSSVSGPTLTTAGGGGGGGGVLIGTATVVPNTPMVITVGAGGTFTSLSSGPNGANSSIYSVAQGTAYTAFGGQGGGYLGTMSPDGGCGGGGSPGTYNSARPGGWPGGNGYQNGPFNDAGQGFAGGAGLVTGTGSTEMWGGGGGGAGSRGKAASPPSPRAGKGGAGITWVGAPSSNSIYYDGQYGIGGGGGGRVYGSEGKGAGFTGSDINKAGGGGHADNPGKSGAVNLGMGGGGNGGSGGSGAVMIRYRDTFRPPVSTSGTLTSVVEYGWRNFRWTASGDIIF